MSYDDDKLGTLFPTRFGGDTGSGNERQMLDKTGADGIRKSYRTLADGSVVRLETRNGLPRFFLDDQGASAETATKCELGMDSGVVNLINASFVWNGEPNGNGSDGLLYRTSYVAQYLTATGAGDENSPIVDVIKPPNTKGTPQADGSVAKSFRSTTGNQFGVYEKKRVAVLCPPSIFTGKMRLYVQALYGRHDALSVVSLSLSVGTTTPSIIVNEIELHTSCGIYLDPLTAKHSLISVGATITIYPLITSPCAEKLRPKLLEPSISAANKERIEAYILSRAYPTLTGATTLSVEQPSIAASSSMGYGWHFNWSGTACDIVINEVVNAPGGGGENESTHYRITFAKGTAWTASLTKVEGPIRWKGQRHNHPITSPAWMFNALEKFGAHYGPEPYGNAPIYVFYKRDDLQTCRYATTQDTTNKRATRSPSYLNPGSMLTQGTDAMDYRVYNEWSGPLTSVTCGDGAVSFKSGTYSGGVNGHSSPQVQVPSLDAASWYRGDVAGSGTVLFPEGKYLPVQTTPTNNEYEGVIDIFRGVEGQSGAADGAEPSSWFTYTYPEHPARTSFSTAIPFPANWTSYSSTEYNLHTTAFIVVIPFYDAEAVFMLGTKTEYKSESGTKITKTGGSFFQANATGGLYAAYPDTLCGIWEIMWSDYGENLSTETYTTEYPPVTTTTTRLVSSAGTVPGITIPTPGAFFNPTYDIVPVMLPCYSSCNGALFSWQGNALSGMPSFGDKPFSFVGWA